jgi:N utilization substance protein A
VPYSGEPQEFVMRALAPAKVREVRIHENTGIAEVIVPDFQLSLAIGKEGQNARLAARLTGWRVDIKSETQLAEEESGGGYAEGEWVEGSDGQLMWQPAGGGEAISAAEAGYGTVTAGGAAPDGNTPERDDAVIPVDDTVDTTPPAEEAAVHIDESVADQAADELAADADLDAEDPDVRAEEELEIEEESAITAGDDA